LQRSPTPVPPSAIRTTVRASSPCATHVTFSARVGRASRHTELMRVTERTHLLCNSVSISPFRGMAKSIDEANLLIWMSCHVALSLDFSDLLMIITPKPACHGPGESLRVRIAGSVTANGDGLYCLQTCPSSSKIGLSDPRSSIPHGRRRGPP
jgi:hypothetical protein